MGAPLCTTTAVSGPGRSLKPYIQEIPLSEQEHLEDEVIKVIEEPSLPTVCCGSAPTVVPWGQSASTRGAIVSDLFRSCIVGHLIKLEELIIRISSPDTRQKSCSNVPRARALHGNTIPSRQSMRLRRVDRIINIRHSCSGTRDEVVHASKRFFTNAKRFNVTYNDSDTGNGSWLNATVLANQLCVKIASFQLSQPGVG
eukprot:gene6608-4729_t